MKAKKKILRKVSFGSQLARSDSLETHTGRSPSPRGSPRGSRSRSRERRSTSRERRRSPEPTPQQTVDVRFDGERHDLSAGVPESSGASARRERDAEVSIGGSEHTQQQITAPDPSQEYTLANEASSQHLEVVDRLVEAASEAALEGTSVEPELVVQGDDLASSTNRASQVASDVLTASGRQLLSNITALYFSLSSSAVVTGDRADSRRGFTFTETQTVMSDDDKVRLANSLIALFNPRYEYGITTTEGGGYSARMSRRDDTSGQAIDGGTSTWSRLRNLMSKYKKPIFDYIGGITSALSSGDWNIGSVLFRFAAFKRRFISSMNIQIARMRAEDMTLLECCRLCDSLYKDTHVRATLEKLRRFIDIFEQRYPQNAGFPNFFDAVEAGSGGTRSTLEAIVYHAQTNNIAIPVKTICRYIFIKKKTKRTRDLVEMATSYAMLPPDHIKQAIKFLRSTNSHIQGDTEDLNYYLEFAIEVFALKHQGIDEREVTSSVRGTPYSLYSKCCNLMSTRAAQHALTVDENNYFKLIERIIAQYTALITEVGPKPAIDGEIHLWIQSYVSRPGGVGFLQNGMVDVNLDVPVMALPEMVPYNMLRELKYHLRKIFNNTAEVTSLLSVPLRTAELGGSVYPPYNLIYEILKTSNNITQRRYYETRFHFLINSFAVRDPSKLVLELAKISGLLKQITKRGGPGSYTYATVRDIAEIRLFWVRTFNSVIDAVSTAAVAGTVPAIFFTHLKTLPFVSKILWRSGRLVSLVSWQLLKFTVTKIKSVSGIMSFIGFTNTAALSLFMLLTFAGIHVRDGRDINSTLTTLDEDSDFSALNGVIENTIKSQIIRHLNSTAEIFTVLPTQQRSTNQPNLQTILTALQQGTQELSGRQPLQNHTNTFFSRPSEFQAPTTGVTSILDTNIQLLCQLAFSPSSIARAARNEEMIFNNWGPQNPGTIPQNEEMYNNSSSMAPVNGTSQELSAATNHMRGFFGPVFNEFGEQIMSLFSTVASASMPDPEVYEQGARAGDATDPSEESRATDPAITRTNRPGEISFGKIKKILKPYREFMEMPKKGSRGKTPTLKTRFGNRKIKDDSRGMYLNANGKRWYIYKWGEKIR